MDHVDGVVHADPDREGGDDRGDQPVGDVQQRHRAQDPDEDEHDRPDRDGPQGGPAQCDPEEEDEDAEGDGHRRADRLRLAGCDLVGDRDRQDARRRHGDGVVVAGPQRFDLLLEHGGGSGVIRVGRELQQDRVDTGGIVGQDVAKGRIHRVEPVQQQSHH